MRKPYLRLVERLFNGVAGVLPSRLLVEIYRRTGAELCLSLCLHRVGPRRPSDPYPSTTAEPHAIDRFLELAGGGGPRLTLCFDDGYADAAAYVASRAPWFPEVEWLLFVCPQKLKQGAGFRWDLFEVRASAGRESGELDEVLNRDLDPERENSREDLRELGRRAEYALATVEQLVCLRRLANVDLGNHTNTHFALNALTDAQAERELSGSTADFEALFGPMRTFAFPFGLPGAHWRPVHAAELSKLRPGVVMFSTADGLFARSERRAGEVLPRVVFRGQWSGEAMMLWVSGLALRRRLNELAARLRGEPDPVGGAEVVPIGEAKKPSAA
jgi:hypothetical protein